MLIGLQENVSLINVNSNENQKYRITEHCGRYTHVQYIKVHNYRLIEQKISSSLLDAEILNYKKLIYWFIFVVHRH